MIYKNKNHAKAPSHGPRPEESQRLNGNEYTTTPNICNTGKPVLRGGFTAMQAYVQKQEKFQVHNLILQLKKFEN